MRREIPLAITFLVGVTMLFSNFFSVPLGADYSLKALSDELLSWVIIITAFAVGLASVNLVKIHADRVSRQRPGWINSILLLTFLFGWAILGIAAFHNPNNEWLWSLDQSLYDHVLASLGSAMFAILAFYLGSASYRAFRMRSFDAAVLLIAAVIVMLGKAPIGELIWGQFPVISTWLLDVPNMVGQRAIMIGAAIGAFATSMRVLLGIERSHLGGTD